MTTAPGAAGSSTPPPSPPGSERPLSFNEAFKEELQALRPGKFDDFSAKGYVGWDEGDEAWARNKDERSQNLRSLYDRIGEPESARGVKPLVALCLSGGGIRSATFNLGVLQALARIGLLGRFDYLSSVSGGGYIAGWLKAWMLRNPDGSAAVIDALGNPKSKAPKHPLDPEPKPIDRLREYSNYLTPKVGLFSLDSWAVAATYLRNLILNWMVILPALALLTTISQVGFIITQALWDPHAAVLPTLGITWLNLLLIAAVVLGLVAAYNIHRYRRGPKETSQNRIMVGGILPLVGSMLLLSGAALWLPFQWESHLPRAVAYPESKSLISNGDVWIFALVWCVGVPLVGWVIREPAWRRTQKYAWPWQELVALILSGGVSAALLVWLAHEVHPLLLSRPALYVVFAFPALLLVYLVARTLFPAFASMTEGRRPRGPDSVAGAADREWWARLSGWILLILLGWVLISSLSLLGGPFLSWLGKQKEYLPQLVAALGGVSGIVTALLGGSGDAPSGRAGGQTGSRVKAWIVALAAPLFCVSLGVLLAYAAMWLGRLLTQDNDLLRTRYLMGGKAHYVELGTLGLYLLVPLVLAIAALFMSFFVNVNRFSLHGFYRDRLIRAYLGASNPSRKPNAFTGFDVADDLRLASLRDQSARLPLPVINTALNLVMGQSKLAWQQRKAESFSMTPYHCGNFHEGYRRTEQYGGPAGISLGSAMTVSGAAANPNMGYHSSPTITFLMGLFNARLGAWLGNTNERGNVKYRLEGPRGALRPLFSDLFGLSNAQARYVNLSDGGHFDNLGLYEMVLRRCRYILVSDAGRDPVSALGDLGNVIRKVRIDFGVSIDFTSAIRILPRSEKEIGLYCAVAEIQYKGADGASVENGTLVYIKPTLTGRGKPIPYDVISYSKTKEDFPHESTTDQWFDEAQFESYRALGFHLLMQIVNPNGRDPASIAVPTFPEFIKEVQEYIKDPPAKTP